MRLLKGFVVATVFFTVVVSGSATLGQDDWRADYAVGDAVHFTISGRASDVQPCSVSENDTGSPMRVQCGTFKQWKAGIYMVYGPEYLTGAMGINQPDCCGEPQETLLPADFPGFEWRATYPVGTTVRFTASGRPGDAQTCMVSENRPNSVMRVQCDAFESWRAGEHIVYAPEYIADDDGQPGWDPPAPPQDDKEIAGGDVKLGNYACYGTGGAVLAGFNFNLLPGNRYVDASGNNGGEYSVDGGDILFAGGELDGMRYRQTAPNHYRLGAQASCEPF